MQYSRQGEDSADNWKQLHKEHLYFAVIALSYLCCCKFRASQDALSTSAFS